MELGKNAPGVLIDSSIQEPVFVCNWSKAHYNNNRYYRLLQ